MSAKRPFGIAGLENPEVIGQGGFGTVYRVDEPEFGRQVAVKVIQQRLDDDAMRRAFVRECQAMGSLSGHPHIVTVHRGGTTEGGEPYIVMDLMTAGSLADRLARDGPLPWAEVLEIGVTVAGALETAHRAGILHLDLKPANLLVSRYGEPKLGDFGISRLPGVAETTDSRVKASIAYASPERLLDGTATVASDIYGLGATMFTLLTGRPAFTGETTDDLIAMVARVVRDPVPDLRARGVPDVVARVVERLMEKSPSARFASASDAASALQAAQRATGRPVTRAVVEGELPPPGQPVIPPPPTGAPPPRPLVPGLAARGGAFGGPEAGARPVLAGTSRPPSPWSPGSAGSRPPRIAGPTGPAGPAGRPGVAGPMPYAPAAPAMPPRRRRTGIIVTAVAVAVVVLGATGIALVANAASRTTGGGTTTAASPVPTPSPTVGLTVPPSSAVPTPEPLPPDLEIGIADGVTHPELAGAATVMNTYFVAINESDYDLAFALFSPDSTTYKGGLEAWRASQSTSVIAYPQVNAVRDAGPGSLDVDVTFQSTQAPEFGFEGQACTNWSLTYELVGPQRLIRKARFVDQPQAC